MNNCEYKRTSSQRIIPKEYLYNYYRLNKKMQANVNVHVSLLIIHRNVIHSKKLRGAIANRSNLPSHHDIMRAEYARMHTAYIRCHMDGLRRQSRGLWSPTSRMIITHISSKSKVSNLFIQN